MKCYFLFRILTASLRGENVRGGRESRQEPWHTLQSNVECEDSRQEPPVWERELQPASVCVNNGQGDHPDCHIHGQEQEDYPHTWDWDGHEIYCRSVVDKTIIIYVNLSSTKQQWFRNSIELILVTFITWKLSRSKVQPLCSPNFILSEIRTFLYSTLSYLK